MVASLRGIKWWVKNVDFFMILAFIFLISDFVNLSSMHRSGQSELNPDDDGKKPPMRALQIDLAISVFNIFHHDFFFQTDFEAKTRCYKLYLISHLTLINIFFFRNLSKSIKHEKYTPPEFLYNHPKFMFKHFILSFSNNLVYLFLFS